MLLLRSPVSMINSFPGRINESLHISKHFVFNMQHGTSKQPVGVMHTDASLWSHAFGCSSLHVGWIIVYCETVLWELTHAKRANMTDMRVYKTGSSSESHVNTIIAAPAWTIQCHDIPRTSLLSYFKLHFGVVLELRLKAACISSTVQVERSNGASCCCWFWFNPN